MKMKEMLMLKNSIDSVLVTKDEISRKISPFSLKYKLAKQKDNLESTVRFFEEERNSLIKLYGDSNADGTISIKDNDKVQKFKEDLEMILDSEVMEESLIVLSQTDFSQLIETLDGDVDPNAILIIEKLMVK